MTATGAAAESPVVAEARGRLLGHLRVLLGAELVVRGLVFLTALVAARRLGTAQFGYASIALAVVSYAVVLGDGGLTSLTQIRLIRSGGRDDRLVASAGAVQLGLALLAACVVGTAVWALPFPSRVRVLVVWALPLLVGYGLNCFYVLEASERMASVARLRTTAQVVTTAVCLVALGAGLGAPSLPLSSVVGLLVADVACLALLLRQRLWHWRRPDPRLMSSLLRHAGPYLAALVATQAIINADVVILGLYRPAAEVAEYDVVFRLASSTLSLVAVLITAVFPELVRRLAGPPGRATGLLLRLLRVTTRAGFAVMALVVLSAQPLTTLLFGHDYVHGAQYLRVVFALVPIGFCNSILAQALVAAGRQTMYLRVVAVTAVATVIALLLTVPTYGAWAAAWVVVGAELLSLASLTVGVRGALGLRPLPTTLAQLPFLLIPLVSGLLAESALHANAWSATVVAAVVALVCDAVAPHRVRTDLRDLLVRRQHSAPTGG